MSSHAVHPVDQCMSRVLQPLTIPMSEAHWLHAVQYCLEHSFLLRRKSFRLSPAKRHALCSVREETTRLPNRCCPIMDCLLQESTSLVLLELLPLLALVSFRLLRTTRL